MKSKREIDREKAAPGVEITEEFHTKVVGVTYPNDDGSDRQKIIGKCKLGESLKLIHTPIKQDRHAVRVCRQNGDQLGWLGRDVAEEIAELLDAGETIHCEVASLTGGTRDKPTRGCNILITKLVADPDK